MTIRETAERMSANASTCLFRSFAIVEDMVRAGNLDHWQDEYDWITDPAVQANNWIQGVSLQLGIDIFA